MGTKEIIDGKIVYHKTVREVFDALEKNGFEYVRGTWFHQEDDMFVGGCILGQGALNLHTYAQDDTYSVPLYDGLKTDLFSQLNRFSVDPESKASRWIDNGVGLVGNLIVGWNDKVIWNEALKINEYALATYGDVLNMAREILEPIFDEVVNLANKEYKVPSLAMRIDTTNQTGGVPDQDQVPDNYYEPDESNSSSYYDNP